MSETTEAPPTRFVAVVNEHIVPGSSLLPASRPGDGARARITRLEAAFRDLERKQGKIVGQFSTAIGAQLTEKVEPLHATFRHVRDKLDGLYAYLGRTDGNGAGRIEELLARVEELRDEEGPAGRELAARVAQLEESLPTVVQEAVRSAVPEGDAAGASDALTARLDALTARADDLASQLQEQREDLSKLVAVLEVLAPAVLSGRPTARPEPPREKARPPEDTVADEAELAPETLMTAVRWLKCPGPHQTAFKEMNPFRTITMRMTRAYVGVGRPLPPLSARGYRRFPVAHLRLYRDWYATIRETLDKGFSVDPDMFVAYFRGKLADQGEGTGHAQG